jgi:hypothetical protein
MNTSEYAPTLSRGRRVRLIKHHPHNGRQCTIIDVRPNPSKLTENQWYDVQFDDYTVGRFLEKEPRPNAAQQEKPAARKTNPRRIQRTPIGIHKQSVRYALSHDSVRQ